VVWNRMAGNHADEEVVFYVKVRARARVRVSVSVRVRVKVNVKVRVSVKVKVRVNVRVSVRVKVKVGEIRMNQTMLESSFRATVFGPNSASRYRVEPLSIMRRSSSYAKRPWPRYRSMSKSNYRLWDRSWSGERE
jgi:hypothetical protein